tara:strand:- start:293 stop:946 length:654 start_codon:yes stop_codon:yes gene_type:complete
MAQDLMRTGPEGATAQASVLGSQVVQLVPAYNGTFATAYADTQANSIDESRDNVFVKLTANGYAMTIPQNTKELFGGQWVVEKLFAIIHTNFATNALNIDVGVYSRNPSGGALSAVDADGIVDGYQITVATGLTGTIFDIPLNGVGGSFESYTTAAGNTVSMKLGTGVGQYSAADADITGFDQFLVVTNTDAGGSGGAGKVSFFARLKPVGGSEYKN